jgi:hypothetical protein
MCVSLNFVSPFMSKPRRRARCLSNQITQGESRPTTVQKSGRCYVVFTVSTCMSINEHSVSPFMSNPRLWPRRLARCLSNQITQGESRPTFSHIQYIPIAKSLTFHDFRQTTVSSITFSVTFASTRNNIVLLSLTTVSASP